MTEKISKHDLLAGINIICCLLGIGALTMPNSMAKAGLGYGIIAIISMTATNIYATILLTLCFFHVPAHVVTYTDLGEHVMGKMGKIMVQLSQFGTCLSLPIVFLILGGNDLLPQIFPNGPSETVWIVIMAVLILPVVLIRSFEEAYWVMILGALTTFFSIMIATVSSATTQPWNISEQTEVEFKNVISVFGALALAYGAAVIVPTIQREHPDPRNLPKVSLISMGSISILYLTIGILGYTQFGCVAPRNLLLSMNDGVPKRMAFVFMQIHIMIALAALLSPALFYVETKLLHIPASVSNAALLPRTSNEIESKDKTLLPPTSQNQIDPETDLKLNSNQITTQQRIQSAVFRISTVMVQAFLAVLTRKSFEPVGSFIGATGITTCCIVLPCLFYFKLFRHQMSMIHKILCVFVIITSLIVGSYSAGESFMQMVKDTKTSAMSSENLYPYCPASKNITVDVSKM